MSSMHRVHPNYKRTTDQQYRVLKAKMAILTQKTNNSSQMTSATYKQHTEFWEELTVNLNRLGPPYRSLQQWKKVWSDFRRSVRKRSGQTKHKEETQHFEKESNCNNKINEGALKEEEEEVSQSQYELEQDYIKSETEEYEQNFQTMHVASYANEYENDDYAYPDEPSMQESYENEDDNEILIPDESSSSSYNYNQRHHEVPLRQQIYVNRQAATLPPPPLQPSNARLIDQTLYALQNQMDYQTKLLEKLAHMSGTMSNLMERQVSAVEKQAEAMRRQAVATERHTFVMNNFIDMIRDKMLKGKTNNIL